MVIWMRNKEKKIFGYNNHLLIVINLIRTDVVTIRGLHIFSHASGMAITIVQAKF